ncbi:MAG: hypothetical protein NVS9B10_09690 [Nevskia sp.]
MIETETALPEVDAAGFRVALADMDGLLLVEYFADPCIWCTRLEPVLAAAQHDYLNRVRMLKVNVGLHPQTLPEGGIRGTPTVALFRGGSLLMTRSGLIQRGALYAFLDHWLDPANEGLSGR